LKPDNSWLRVPPEEGCRSSAWDGYRARSNKRHSNGGAERGSHSKNRRLSKQRLQRYSQAQQQFNVRRNSYNGGNVAAEAGGHRTKAKDGQPRSTRYSGAFCGKENSTQPSPVQPVRKILELNNHLESVSTQTLAEEAKGSQTEPVQDEAVSELKHKSHQHFSLSAYDSDDDESEFFPNTDPVHGPVKEGTE